MTRISTQSADLCRANPNASAASRHPRPAENRVLNGQQMVLCYAVFVALAGNTLAFTNAAQATSLLNRSPFIPASFSAPSTAPATTPSATARRDDYEFRGFYEISGEYRFLISEARSRSGSWIAMGGVHEQIEVRSFDADSETLTLAINNEVRELKLASLESNPTPQPVATQARPATRPAVRPTTAAPTTTASTPVRRTIRPATTGAAATPLPITTQTRPSSSATPAPQQSAPPPAWLQELRDRAAERRAEAAARQP